METTYKFRLEFNEKQQQFHHDNYTHEADTFGWFTIMDECSDMEFHIFEAYVKRVKVGKLTKEYLLKCAEELKTFTSNLLDSSLVVSRDWKLKQV